MAAGADPNRPGGKGCLGCCLITPLAVAASSSQYAAENVAVLLQGGARLAVPPPACGYLLNDVQSPAAIRLLLDAGADPNERGPGGQTPLFTVCNEEAAQLLLERGADATVRNRQGATVLMGWASACGTAKTIQQLLAHGASPHATDQNGRNALHYALRAPNVPSPAAVAALLAAGVRTDQRDRAGRTPRDEFTQPRFFTLYPSRFDRFLLQMQGADEANQQAERDYQRIAALLTSD